MSTPPIQPNSEMPAARSPLSEAWEMFRRNHAAMVALVVLSLIVLLAIFGPYIYPVDPFDMVWAPFSPPGVDGFWLGTDYL
jgi:peptide/nickel transport system permease protein